MVGERKKPKKNAYSDEEVWIRAFVRFHGTEAVSSFCVDDLHGVSLTRIVQALKMGFVTYASKSDGPGTTCIVAHTAEEDTVYVTVHFVSNEERLRILAADRIEEHEGGTISAA